MAASIGALLVGFGALAGFVYASIALQSNTQSVMPELAS